MSEKLAFFGERWCHRWVGVCVCVCVCDVCVCVCVFVCVEARKRFFFRGAENIVYTGAECVESGGG